MWYGVIFLAYCFKHRALKSFTCALPCWPSVSFSNTTPPCSWNHSLHGGWGVPCKACPPLTFGPITCHSQRTLPLQLPNLLPVPSDPPGCWVLPFSKQAHLGVSHPGSMALWPFYSFSALLLTPSQNPCLYSLSLVTHRVLSIWPIPVSPSPRTAGPCCLPVSRPPALSTPGAPRLPLPSASRGSPLPAPSCWTLSPVLAPLTLPSLGSAAMPRGLCHQPAGSTLVMLLRTQPLSSAHALLQWASQLSEQGRRPRPQPAWRHLLHCTHVTSGLLAQLLTSPLRLVKFIAEPGVLLETCVRTNLPTVSSSQ